MATKKKAASKTASKKTASKKTAARKTAAKKTATRKAAAKKTVATVKREAAAPTGGRVRVTQVRSAIGRLKNHKACLAGLGLRRMHQTVEVLDTPENRGMINRVAYMVTVEEG